MRLSTAEIIGIVIILILSLGLVSVFVVNSSAMSKTLVVSLARLDADIVAIVAIVVVLLSFATNAEPSAVPIVIVASVA